MNYYDVAAFQIHLVRVSKVFYEKSIHNLIFLLLYSF